MPPTGAEPSQRILLHVGCGHARPERLPEPFRSPDWREVRLDIDPAVKPDIVASVTDLSVLADARVDAIFSSHNLEHLHSYEVPKALAEFRRVLKPDGYLLVTLPDIGAVARHIAAGNLTEPLYHSPAGPISPLDILFGHQAAQQAGMSHMAHRTGFNSTLLGEVLLQAGFTEVRVHEGSHWDLWAVALMPHTPTAVFDELDIIIA